MKKTANGEIVRDEGVEATQETNDTSRLRRMVMNKCPYLLLDSNVPAAWSSGIRLSQRIDVAMHLLFLGVTKSLVFAVREWTKIKEKGTLFTNLALEVIRHIPGVAWCKCAPFTGERLGGWVSENYLAMARISRWFFTTLESVVTDYQYDPSD
jgi:hypothetical protein